VTAAFFNPMLSSCIENASGVCEPLARLRPQRLTLRVNFVWTLAGNVTYAACQWGILVALAKLGTPQMVGEFALALAVTAPILIGAGLSLRSVQATDALREYEFSDYFSLRLLTSTAAVLAVGGVVLFSPYGARVGAVILIVGIAKGFESISEIVHGLWQQHERMDLIARSLVLKGVLSLGVVALAVYFTDDLRAGACGLAFVWALMLLFYDARWAANVSGVARPLRLRWRPRTLGALAWFALPAGVVIALVSFNINLPRYFIEHHLGTAQLGIFAAMAYPMVAGATVVGALGQSATPRLSQYYASGDRCAFLSLLLKLAGLASAVGLAAVLVIALAGRPILLLLYRPEYAEHVTAFLLLAVATALGYVASILGYAMTAARYFRAQLPVFMLTTAVTAAACALLVPRQQLSGAALAMGFATLCQDAVSAAVIVHALKNKGTK
jgi:O-antigen/teichoic acid export membrane protein